MRLKQNKNTHTMPNFLICQITIDCHSYDMTYDMTHDMTYDIQVTIYNTWLSMQKQGHFNLSEKMKIDLYNIVVVQALAHP